MTAPAHERLQTTVGLGGAIMLGLGSILGTGVFVSIGIAAGVAGPAVLLAIALAAVVAGFNALSSAQLAAAHPVSGGTYAYGYRFLKPWLGFTAGWMFLCAKTASAATAALGFAGYLLHFAALDSGPRRVAALGGATVVVLTGIVLAGLRRSNLVNTLIVALTLLALGAFIALGLGTALERAPVNLRDYAGIDGGQSARSALLHATALMFVAFAGYARITTLSEEVHEPRRTIPRAIIFTLLVTLAIYALVAFVAVATTGAGALAATTRATAAPLEVIAREFHPAGIDKLVAIGAMTAMLGVLLNLILGLSRVLMAMGRRGDVPRALGRLNAAHTTPTAAVIVVGLAIFALALTGNVKTTWSFSAFTVLIYYALTNLAALRIPAAERLYPRWIAWAGLVCCCGLAFRLEREVWLTGLGVIAAGLAWHATAVRLRGAARN